MFASFLSTPLFVLIIVFFAHFISVLIHIDFGSNLLAPVISFYSAYIIFHSGKERKNSWKILFSFCLSWGIADTLWLITENFMGINPEEVLIISILYSFSSALLAVLVTTIYFKTRHKWNIAQFLIDLISICSILLILMWTFIFSKTGLIFYKQYNYWDITIYMFSDFYALSGFLLLYCATRKEHLTKATYFLIIGIVIFTSCDFYFAYLTLTHSYEVNTLIDAIYLFPHVLFAFYLYYKKHDSNYTVPLDTENLPMNYGKPKRLLAFCLILLFLVLGYFYEIKMFFLITGILILHQIISSYIQIAIKNEYLFKLELNLNEYLHEKIEEKIHDLKLANEALEEISNRDNLTGLYNRRYFTQYLDHLIETSTTEPFILLYLDLNNFKCINDLHGHEFGDQVLLELGKRFSKNCVVGCHIFRIGGDEFAIIVEKIPHHTYIHQILEKLFQLCQSPISIPPYQFQIEWSIGIALYPNDATKSGMLMRYAEIAMYEAKKQKKGHKFKFFDIGLSEKIQKKHKIEQLLKKANYETEFQLYYQPQYSIQKNNLVGMEALLRWIHPKEGIISPADFIPIAEETGQILKIGEWVMDKAMDQIKQWNLQYKKDYQIGINISPVQIQNTDFVHLIRVKVESQGILPHWIDLEITEGVAMNYQLSMQEIISGLEAIGVSISIDDFGTGYSSLSYIKHFNINRLKIAKELIDNIAEDKNTLLITKAIIMMAQGMGLTTIAEGVEDTKQLNILRELGCDEIQGYIWGRPVPAKEFEKLHLLKNTIDEHHNL